jgi:hypothetical protein
MRAPNETSSTPSNRIDEHFCAQWINRGLLDLQAYLAKHARFAAYCDRRDAGAQGSLGSGPGRGPQG